MFRSLIMSSCATALLLAGCVTPSLHPLVTEETAIFEPALIGKWVDKKDGHTWTFEKREENAYNLTHAQTEGDTIKFVAALVKLGDNLFLNTIPEEMPADNDLLTPHLILAYLPLHLQLTDNELNLSGVDNEWLDKAIQQNQISITHQRTAYDTILLTAPTAELRQFFATHTKTPEAFTELAALRRDQ